MANLTKQQTDMLLGKGLHNVAIIAYRESSSNPENVNLMYAEVVESTSSDNGAFNALMGGSSLQVKYAWAPAKKAIAEKLFDIKDATANAQTTYIENPKIGEQFLKVRRIETFDSEKGREVINPSTGEIMVHPNGQQIFRIESVVLVDEFASSIADVKLPREEKAKVETPFSIDAL
jgi:hypothetical protein